MKEMKAEHMVAVLALAKRFFEAEAFLDEHIEKPADAERAKVMGEGVVRAAMAHHNCDVVSGLKHAMADGKGRPMFEAACIVGARRILESEKKT